ncbi:Formin-like protein 6 [Mycena indigotica]|uniref:Formin-like protein 6 n=1 Tax=Mycena indigotica TaxID=2126181 RepID=A0A8H6SPI5_9AGAR|nr:Formin-like protein 6 [Mycena indigotica]KAF7302007.1 Formin-like protein 6 [Mycena indigotica]
MGAEPLIVPTLLPTGNLHFATVEANATAQHVLNDLITNEHVKSEILGDLDDRGWALQSIRDEQLGRRWEEAELEALGDGILPPTTPISPLINATPAIPDRQFSTYHLTSHMHKPALRLVSLHPSLSITFSFSRVPEIHDEFQYKIFISTNTTVGDVTSAVATELGLTKGLPGSNNLEYVLEEVWADGQTSDFTRLPSSSLMYKIVELPFSTNTLTSGATRSFRLAVPEEWYRRSKSRSVSGASLESSTSTLKQFQSLYEEPEEDEDDEDDSDGEGTAKLKSTISPRADEVPAAQKRFSLMSYWSAQNSGPPSPDNRKSVSEPKLVPHFTGGPWKGPGLDSMVEEEDEPFDQFAFDAFVEATVPEGRRAAMYSLPLEKRQQLLSQYRAAKPKSKSPMQSATVGPSSGAALARIIPQVTGDAFRRFSLWGGPAEPEVVQATVEKPVEELQPLQPNITGGVFSSWWSGGGTGEASGRDQPGKWYVDKLRNRKVDSKLAKLLIELNSHASSSEMQWVVEFIDENGMEVLDSLLASLVGGKRRSLTQTEQNVVFNLVKCLRVLLNTTPGLQRAFSSRTLITHMAYALHGSSLKLRGLVTRILAALCGLPADRPEGQKLVLAALTDYRIEFEEAFRFEQLLEFMRDTFDAEGDLGSEEVKREAELWEARTWSMALVNQLIFHSEAFEDRVMLRDEFARRGLNEAVVTLRYLGPTDDLRTQIERYADDKFADEESMRDRARSYIGQAGSPVNHERGMSGSETALADLVRLAKQHGELYPMMMDIMNHYTLILQRDVGLQLKADLLAILDKFVEQAAMLDDFDESWHLFMTRFSSSVVHITGQALEVKAAYEDGSRTIIEQELEALRAKYEELSDERTDLRNKLNDQLAEMNALKSLPMNMPVPNAKSIGKAGQENFHGLVQRLVQREKQVIQLQAEVDRFKAQNPADAREADDRAKRERERARLQKLNDEIAHQKIKADQ